jgi:hypothetical protein
MAGRNGFDDRVAVYDAGGVGGGQLGNFESYQGVVEKTAGKVLRFCAQARTVEGAQGEMGRGCTEVERANVQVCVDLFERAVPASKSGTIWGTAAAKAKEAAAAMGDGMGRAYTVGNRCPLSNIERDARMLGRRQEHAKAAIDFLNRLLGSNSFD